VWAYFIFGAQFVCEVVEWFILFSKKKLVGKIPMYGTLIDNSQKTEIKEQLLTNVVP
jgi:hypothetical protein